MFSLVSVLPSTASANGFPLLWRRRRQADGEVLVIRYADDAVLGFQSQAEAKRFLAQLPERLAKFGLELHPEKTRLIEFGRYATERRKRRWSKKARDL